MTSRIPYFPHDQLFGATPDAELAADLCELAAFFADKGSFLLSDLRNDLEIGGDEYEDVDEHNRVGETAVDSAARVIEHRDRLLGTAYPFTLDESGACLSYDGVTSWAKTAYILCLILSHLKGVTPVLKTAMLEPNSSSEGQLRNWFQKIAAPALAAEVHGHAWAFGAPRDDGSQFLNKLREIWLVIKDGRVKGSAPLGAPLHVKDDEIDIIAARPHSDGDPGFPIAFAQVATGKNWKEKPIRNTVDNVFFPFWFEEPPASQRTSFHVVPFIVDRDTMRRETLRLGHIIHRLRLVSLLAQAEPAIEKKLIHSEGIDAFEKVGRWLKSYRSGDVHAT